MPRSHYSYLSAGVLLGALLWPAMAFAVWAMTRCSTSAVRLPPAPLESEKLARARNAMRTAGFGGGLRPTDAEWVNGLTTPSERDGPGAPCKCWDTSSTVNHEGTATLETLTRDVPDCFSSTPAGGAADSTPTIPGTTLFLAFGFGVPTDGEIGDCEVFPEEWCK